MEAVKTPLDIRKEEFLKKVMKDMSNTSRNKPEKLIYRRRDVVLPYSND